MRAHAHFPSSSFASASRWLREPAAATVAVASVILAVEEVCGQGGAFIGGPFFTDRGIGVLVLRPDGTVIEYLQADESDDMQADHEPEGRLQASRLL